MKFFLRLFLAVHVFIYRISKGKLLGKFGGNTILLLDTVGRKSGQKRTTPVMYFRNGKNYIITASNGGAATQPGWYFNLKSNPKTTIQVMGETIKVNAQEAPAKDRERLWKQLTAQAPQFAEYAKKTERTIPMFILRPSA